MAKTRAQLNKAIRQEALRQQLAAQKHHEYVSESIKKIEELSASGDASEFEIKKWKAAAELRLKLVNKYLPDLKQQDITLGGDPDKPLTVVAANMTPEEAHEAYLKMLNE